MRARIWRRSRSLCRRSSSNRPAADRLDCLGLCQGDLERHPESIEDLDDALTIRCPALFQLRFDVVLATFDPLGDRLGYTCSEAVGLSSFHASASCSAMCDGTGCEVLGVEGLLEQLFGALFADCLPTAQPRAGEEHLLMEAKPRLADEDQARDRHGEGFLQAGNDDCGDSFQRSFAAPEGRPQPAGGALQQWAAEVHVDDIGILGEHSRVEGDRAKVLPVEGGRQPTRHLLPGTAERGQSKDRDIGAIGADSSIGGRRLSSKADSTTRCRLAGRR